MQIQLLLQTIILPLLLSFAVYKTVPQNTRWQAAGLFFAWLPACFWILNIPALPPAEAVDWLWLAGLVFVAIQYLPAHYRKASQLAVFILSLLIISWPVLQYELSPGLIAELLLMLLVAAMLVTRGTSSSSPALIISMSATALALCTALAGSLLIAQLAGALAAAAGVFAIAELGKRLTSSHLQTSTLLPLALLYLLLLAITRLYAEMPTGPALLLLVAPLSLRLKNRAAPGLTLLAIMAAAGWLLLLQESNSYY